MKQSVRLLSGACLFLLATTAAWAPCLLTGYVYCDVNQDGVIDGGDTALSGVGVLVDGAPVAVTDQYGYYHLDESIHICGAEMVSLDMATLPADTTFVDPAANGVTYITHMRQDWLIDSAVCQPSVSQPCWLTAGGVKFDSVAQMLTAQHPANDNGRGPKDSVGGVAYPGCSPFASNGGQWNHVAHSLKLHLIGQDITVLRCGNVPDIPPGSESPVCAVNFIEFEGTGVVKGIHGNKIEDTPVSFFVRAEDRNEPGNEQALNSDEGGLIDRYFLRVVDGDGNVLILVDMNGVDGNTIDPLTITGGNFQIHCTSCD
jgi:hypothetical protein